MPTSEHPDTPLKHFSVGVNWGSHPELISLRKAMIKQREASSRGLSLTRESFLSIARRARSQFAEFFSPLALREMRMRDNEKTMREIEAETVLYLVKDFFVEQKRLRERGITLETVYDRVGDLQQKIDFALTGVHKNEQEIAVHESRFDRHGKRLRKLETQVFPNDEEENTGTHRMEELLRAKEMLEIKKRVEDAEVAKRDSALWWRRQRFLWIGAAIVVLLATLGSGCVGLMMWKINQLSSALRPGTRP